MTRTRAAAAALVAGCLLALLVPAAAGRFDSASSARPSADPAGRPSPAAAAASPSTGRTAGGDSIGAALERLLAERARALAAGHLAGWLAVLDPTDAALIETERARFERLRGLPLVSWTYASTAAGTVIRYQLEGDESVSEVPVVPVVRRHRGDPFGGAPSSGGSAAVGTSVAAPWVLADTGQTAPALWDLEGLTTARGAHSLVLAAGPPERAVALAAHADRAVEVVAGAWSRPWSQRLVVVVPATWSAGVALLGRTTAAYEGFAALTTTLDPPGGATPQRILLDPAAVDALTPELRQVLLTHEAVHVATGPSRLPLWLSEGLADEVAYRGLDDAGIRTALPELLAAARAGSLPADLPADRDFAAGSGIAERAYEGAHLLVRILVQAVGPDAVVAAYAAAAADPAQWEAVLGERLGLDRAQLLQRWREEIGRLAVAGSAG